jgi:tetratricopeptide (TPR) repeat protein
LAKKKSKTLPASTLISPRTRSLFIVFTFAILVLAVVLLEVILRLSHYGQDYDLVIPTTKNGKEYFRINPKVGLRYFDRERYSLPEIVADDFGVRKSQNSLRIFVLGESTPAGFPYQFNLTPSHLLQKQLELIFPGRKIEVINASLTATNSYTVLDFIGELVDYKPDVIVVYSGQNEFYGALGVGSTISLGHERWLIRTYQKLRSFRTFVLLENAVTGLLRWIDGNNGAPLPGTLMQQMTKEKAIPYQGNLYRDATDAFERNLRAAIEIARESHIPIILSTLVTNERSLPPFVSMHQESLSDAQKAEVSSLLEAASKNSTGNDSASDEYRKSISIDSMWAMAYFRLAECYDAMGKFDSAKTAYGKARDLDGLRFRAPSEYNQIIRSLAKPPTVIAADVESTFRAQSPNGILGKELLWEHVHPRLEGYILLSRTWCQALGQLSIFSPEDRQKLSQSISDSLLFASVRWTALDEEIGAATMKTLLHRWPFTESTSTTDTIPANDAQNVAQIFTKRSLRWSEAHYELADAYMRKKDLPGALKEYEAVSAMYPDNPFPPMRIGDLYTLLQDYRKAEQSFLTSLSLSEDQFVRFKLGVVYLRGGESDAAIKQISSAIEINDRSRVQFPREQYEEAKFYYALALHQSGRNEEALRALAALLRQNPNAIKATRLAQEIQNGIKK